ncbi:MAG: type II toxin-antitoxin system RelE family toxin [Pyrinomonadaceae bacterium]
MTYSISILRRAQKALTAFPRSDYIKMRDAIRALAEEPRPTGCRKLVGRDGWRIRVGNYRAIYEVDDQNAAILILAIGDRKDIYS